MVESHYERLQRAGQVGGLASRDWMRRNGRTQLGQKLWEDHENAAIRSLWPDYEAIKAALPHRTYGAIQAQAARIGASAKGHVWTTGEVLRLRRIFPTATHAELLAAFPGVSLRAIRSHAFRLNLRRAVKPYGPTGCALLDELRDRCRFLNLSMADLDAMAGTGTYFQRSGWRSGRRAGASTNRQFSYERVVKGILAIGGNVVADWGEGDES